MATTTPETNATSEYETEIRKEMSEIKKDIAALTKSLGNYGKARAEGLQASATDFTQEMLDEFAPGRQETGQAGRKDRKAGRDRRA